MIAKINILLNVILLIINFNTIKSNITSVGDYHTCSKINSDEIFCFGLNSHGQLGNDIELTLSSNYIKYNKSKSIMDIKSIACGEQSTCVILYNEYTNESLLSCFGNNKINQITKSDKSIISSRLDESLIYVGKIIRDVTIGYRHTCVLLSDGKVTCFGYDMNGEVGIKRSTIPYTQNFQENKFVRLKSEIKMISSGHSHNCAVSIDGKVINCWGKNDFGQLGIKDSSFSNSKNKEEFESIQFKIEENDYNSLKTYLENAD